MMLLLQAAGIEKNFFVGLQKLHDMRLGWNLKGGVAEREVK